MTAALLERERPLTGARAASPRRSAGARGTRPEATGPVSTRSTRPKLKVLNQEAIRQRARRRQALLLMFIVVLLGFFAVAFVHAELVADQQELDGIRAQIAEAEAHKAKVERAAEEASSPQAIVDRASAMGMVRAYEPVYIAATVPVRELPATLTFSGRPDRTPSFAAPATAAGLQLAAGVSGTATVGVVDQVAVAAPVAETGTGQAVAANPAGTPAVIETAAPTTDDGETTTLTGLSVTVSGVASGTRPAAAAPAVASTPAPAASSLAGASIASDPTGSGPGGVVAAVVPQPDRTATSMAGTRAVTAPRNSDGVTSRLGGMSAGTGSG